MKNEVAIIGSGISGLSCAYKLSQSGFKVKVFEKDVIAGGRAPKAIRIVSKEDTNIISLLRDLNYTNLKDATLDKFASYVDGKATSFTRYKPMMFQEQELSFFEKIMRKIAGRMTHVDLNELKELQQHMDSLKFKFKDNDPEIEKLHEISTEEWLQNYSESLQNLILRPMLQITFEHDLSKQTALYGVRQIQKFFRIVWEGGYIIEGGPYAITQEIIKSLRKSGNEVEFLSEVTNVEKSKDGFEVTYQKSDMPEEKKSEKSEKFKYVVFAVPLTISSEIIGEEFDVPYVSTHAIYVRGKLKDRWEAAIGPDYESNFRVLFTLIQGEYYIYPVEPDREISNLKGLFKDGEFKNIGREEVPNAIPRILPNSEIPGLEYKTDGIYLCGDFYYYPSVDTAAATGMMVADKIKAKG